MLKQSDQIKRIGSLFGDREESEIEYPSVGKCDIHRRRRSSTESGSKSIKPTYAETKNHTSGYSNNAPSYNGRNGNAQVSRRQSFTEGYLQSDKARKRNSWSASMFKSIEHPSAFPSLLRSEPIKKHSSVSNISHETTSLSRRSSMSSLNGARPKSAASLTKRQSFGSNIYLRADSFGNVNLVRRDSLGSRNLRDVQVIPNANSGSVKNLAPRDYVSNLSSSAKTTPNRLSSILRKTSIDDDKPTPKLTKENLSRHVRILESDDKLFSDSHIHFDDCHKLRRLSMDSLDCRKNSVDLTDLADFRNLSLKNDAKNENGRPHFVAVTTLEDVQAVRCAEFHPSGRVYAVGSNSKTFRICEYPSLSEIREEHTTYQPTVLFKRTKHHKGSIYCMGWAPDGELVATGSNDKTIKLMRYDDIKKQLEGREIELTMHDGTIRDLCFLEDATNKTSLLISGGAGDCKIYVTDCATATPFQALSGHGGHILSLYNWGGAMFVSGSQDKTIRFWDLRTRGCVNTITPATTPGSRQGAPVAAVCVDPSGRLLVSGHEDSSCVLYDIRGNRPIQCFKPHSSDIRSIRFSPSAYYLLTAGYDNKLVLTDLQGDLTLPLPSVVVAHHTDKVISGRWHPTDFSFLSTSADKTATLWALPPL